MQPEGEVLRGVRRVDNGTEEFEVAYAIAIDELLEWMSRRAKNNLGGKTILYSGMIEARIIGRKKSESSPDTDKA